MADGILCKHCGWSESGHAVGGINPDLVRPGYEKTLRQCLKEGGWQPESKSSRTKNINLNRKK